MSQVDFKRDPINSKVIQGWPQGEPKGPQDGRGAGIKQRVKPAKPRACFPQHQQNQKQSQMVGQPTKTQRGPGLRRVCLRWSDPP